MKFILYAEDDPNDIFFMERAFKKSGVSAQLFTVPDGALAVEYLSGTGAYADRQKFPRPDLILLDLNMPGMNGFDVLVWIRANPEFRSTPVAILTSSNNPHDRQRAIDLGAADYLVKPNEGALLVDLVRTFERYWPK